MATTRFKGETAGERLDLSGISDSDMIQVRHKPGTIDDADKGISKSQLLSCPFGVSDTAASTGAKVASLTDSNPDFTLVSGREVVVCFTTANSASNPTLNFAGSGAIPIYYPNGQAVGAWPAETWMHLKYFYATVGNSTIQRWILLSDLPVNTVASGNMHSVTSNAVADKIGLMGTQALIYNGDTYDGTTKNLTESFKNYRYIYIGLKTNNEYDYFLVPTQNINNGSVLCRTMMMSSAAGQISLPFAYQSSIRVTFVSNTQFYAQGTYNNANWILKVYAIWGVR